MWKAREIHLVDLFKCSQPKDDFHLSTVAVNGTDAEVFCCCCSNDNQEEEEEESNKTKSLRSQQKVVEQEYQGNDFGIFGKEQEQHKKDFTVLVEQFAPQTAIIQLQEKSGQLKANLHDSTIIRKRKTWSFPSTSTSTSEEDDDEEEDIQLMETCSSRGTKSPFINQTTASVKTPALNMFLARTTEQFRSTEHDDLAYY
jgi:lipopolysaccharide export LptBFGC system permease protein LptF